MPVMKDDLLIADHMAQPIESTGAPSVDMAATEEAAVASARDRQPAMIISDVELSEGTGLNAVARSMATTRSCKVMYVTGSPSMREPRVDGTTVLVKPVDDATLMPIFRMLVPPLVG